MVYDTSEPPVGGSPAGGGPVLVQVEIEAYDGTTGRWFSVVGTELARRAVEMLIGANRQVEYVDTGVWNVEMDQAEREELAGAGTFERRNDHYSLFAEMP